MEKLKQSLLLRLAALNSPSIMNSPHVSSLIHNRLQHAFKSFKTPTHPPYHSMIISVMKELNDKSGLSEETISEFIKKEYDQEDLPIAHKTILRIHLKKLCKSGELACNVDGKYVLVDCESELVVKAMFESEEDKNEDEDEDDFD